MLVVGAKGFAKEILEIFHQNNYSKEIAFYDDVNRDIGNRLFGKYRILKNLDEAKSFFDKKEKEFTIGIGNPLLRYKLYKKFNEIGGIFSTTIDRNSIVGSHDVHIKEGCNILAGAIISNSVVAGKGCIVYYNSVITHDCIIGDFVEISPSVNVLGRVKVGSFSQLGANSTILPDVTIGKNVIVGAGSVVTKDVPDNTKVMGVPARIIHSLDQKG